MAKRARKEKTAAERAEIEADRIAAHEGVTGEEHGAEITHDEALQGSKLASGVPDTEITDEQSDEIERTLEAIEGSEDVVEGEVEPEDKVPNSVVKDKFKVKYIENARAQGIPGKAAKRSNWDWLSQQLATFCLNDKHSIDIGAFTDVLEANGVDHSRWTNRNRGWEGRFRMTGRVALQKVVANSGVLKWPTGEPTPAPADFVEKYNTKA